MVDLLIKNGVNINQLTKDGSTPLSWAAYWGSLLKWNKLVSKLDVIIEINNELGNVKVAELLLKNGANMDIPDTKGKTALHTAVIGGNFDSHQFVIIINAIKSTSHSIRQRENHWIISS